MHHTSQKKLSALVVAPGFALAVLATAVYFQINSAQAERRTSNSHAVRLPAASPKHPLPSMPLNIVEPRVMDRSDGARARLHDEETRAPGLTWTEATELLRSDLLQPWKSQATPEHRIMSRAAPRISVEPTFDLESQPLAAMFLGAVTLRRYREQQQLPIVIDRRTHKIYVFADQRWQLSSEWLKPATDTASVDVSGS